MKKLSINKNSIQSVRLNLLNGQVELILRSLELYGYNLKFMLDTSNLSDEDKDEKISLLKYTYEQILSSQAEQLNGKENYIDKSSKIGKIITNEIDNKDK